MANEAFPLLPTTTITTAVTGEVGAVKELGRAGLKAGGLVAQATFDYGSGGTSAKAWVQTSLDNGTTWVDIMSFAFTTADAKKVSSVSTDVAPASQAFAPADGALSDNTVVNGVLGDRLRVKYTTTGTYAGDTTLAVWVSPKAG